MSSSGKIVRIVFKMPTTCFNKRVRRYAELLGYHYKSV